MNELSREQTVTIVHDDSNKNCVHKNNNLIARDICKSARNGPFEMFLFYGGIHNMSSIVFSIIVSTSFSKNYVHNSFLYGRLC